VERAGRQVLEVGLQAHQALPVGDEAGELAAREAAGAGRAAQLFGEAAGEVVVLGRRRRARGCRAAGVGLGLAKAQEAVQLVEDGAEVFAVEVGLAEGARE
jgi:hypothetical protein